MSRDLSLQIDMFIYDISYNDRLEVINGRLYYLCYRV